MIKRVLFSALLTLLYLAAFAAGSFLHPFNRVQALSSQGLGVRLFIWDGVLLMLALFAVTLAIEAAGKRVRDLAAWTTGSLILAAALGFALRLGFVTREF